MSGYPCTYLHTQPIRKIVHAPWLGLVRVCVCEGCGVWSGDGKREDAPENPRAMADVPLATAFAPKLTFSLPTTQAEVVAFQ